MGAYRKELRSTLAFGVIYTLLGHTGLFAVLLGVNNDVRVLGLPLHYFVAIILGSFGVLIVSIVWSRYANRLEDEIEAENTFVLSQQALGATLAQPDAPGAAAVNARFAEAAR